MKKRVSTNDNQSKMSEHIVRQTWWMRWRRNETLNQQTVSFRNYCNKSRATLQMTLTFLFPPHRKWFYCRLTWIIFLLHAWTHGCQQLLGIFIHLLGEWSERKMKLCPKYLMEMSCQCAHVLYLFRWSHGYIAQPPHSQHADCATGVWYPLHHVVHQHIYQHQLCHHVMVQELEAKHIMLFMFCCQQKHVNVLYDLMTFGAVSIHFRTEISDRHFKNHH